MRTVGSLLDGYGVSYEARPERTLEPMMFLLKRTDETIVGEFVPDEIGEDYLEVIRRAAWDDHRRRTLRPVRGGYSRSSR